MTPDEHKAEAERLIYELDRLNMTVADDRADAAVLISLAQVHATLATIRPTEPASDLGGIESRMAASEYARDALLEIGGELASKLKAADATVQRVRDLCTWAMAQTDPGPFPDLEDPTPVPGWVALVENALDGATAGVPA